MEQIGRYRIIGELGRGAMGIVYKAQDPAIGRMIAVKSIRLGELTDESERDRLRERLFREAQSAGILSHPGIVTIYDVAEEGDMAYIFMELVNGPPLEKMLKGEQSPDKETLLSLLRQVALALDYAHKKGIVHRDIKPANIMVHEDGTAKVTDFGVAKIVSQQLTRAGTIMGTPSYMSPEQVQGTAVSGRSDQFSLAVIAYEILTGDKPFNAEYLPTLLYKIVREDFVPPHRLNPTLLPVVESVMQKALAKAPEDRYETCVDFVDALAAACNASPHWVPLPRGGSTNLPTAGSGDRFSATSPEAMAETIAAPVFERMRSPGAPSKSFSESRQIPVEFDATVADVSATSVNAEIPTEAPQAPPPQEPPPAPPQPQTPPLEAALPGVPVEAKIAPSAQPAPPEVAPQAEIIPPTIEIPPSVPVEPPTTEATRTPFVLPPSPDPRARPISPPPMQAAESTAKATPLELPPADVPALTPAARKDKPPSGSGLRNVLWGLAAGIAVVAAVLFFVRSHAEQVSSHDSSPATSSAPATPPAQASAPAPANVPAPAAPANVPAPAAPATAPDAGNTPGPVGSGAAASAVPASGAVASATAPAKSPAPAPATEAQFELTTTPAGAEAVVDGAPDLRCFSPCMLTLPLGRHTLMVKHPGYRDAQRVFSLPSDPGLIVNMEPQSGTLSVVSTPPGLTILVDGQEQPRKTPTSLSLSVGQHRIRVLKGADKQEFTVDIRDGVLTQRNIDWGN